MSTSRLLSCVVVVISALAAVVATPAAIPRTMASDTLQTPFTCTRLARSFWMPLTLLVERLQDSGATVASAMTTHDDCYELQVRMGKGELRTVIYHPVSGKPLQ